jgi:hypothetical protein
VSKGAPKRGGERGGEKGEMGHPKTRKKGKISNLLNKSQSHYLFRPSWKKNPLSL